MEEQPLPTDLPIDVPVSTYVPVPIDAPIDTLLPLPIAVIAPPSKVAMWTKLFGIITVLTLAISVLVGVTLVLGGNEDQSSELACRSRAAISVNQAIVDVELVKGQAIVLNGEFFVYLIRADKTAEDYYEKLNIIADDMEKVKIALAASNLALGEAVNQQQLALKDCEQ